MEATNKTQTPKEKFDAEMKQINKDISADSAPEKEAGYSSEEAADIEDQVKKTKKAMDEEDSKEEVIDKHVGTQKIEVTREQNLSMKLEKQRQEILAKFNQVGGLQKEKLSPKQQEVIGRVLKLAQEEKLDDPVLLHLVGKKIEVAKEYAQLNAEIKEVQLMIVDKMAKLATACTDSQAMAKTYNRDILLYVQKNPSLIEAKDCE